MEKTEAYQRFLSSMTITHDSWKEGIGYDLDALEEATDAERDLATKLLAERIKTTPDWRDIEALETIGTPEARKAIRGALRGSDLETKLRAAEALRDLGEEVDIEGYIIEALKKGGIFGGLTQALEMAEEYPSERIQKTLLYLAKNGDEEQRVHCAALALYLGGKAKEAFDWDHRPFFLQFGEDDPAVRREAYKELLRRLGRAE